MSFEYMSRFQRVFAVALHVFVSLVLIGTVSLIFMGGLMETKPTVTGHQLVARIRPGMDIEDVEQLLKPHTVPMRRDALVCDLYGGGVCMWPGTLREWWLNDCVIQIAFDEDNKVLQARAVGICQIESNSWLH
jgi:hypothetical protein